MPKDDAAIAADVVSAFEGLWDAFREEWTVKDLVDSEPLLTALQTGSALFTG